MQSGNNNVIVVGFELLLPVSNATRNVHIVEPGYGGGITANIHAAGSRTQDERTGLLTGQNLQRPVILILDEFLASPKSISVSVLSALRYQACTLCQG